MADRPRLHPVKALLVDAIMAVIFLSLLGVSIWIAWVFYVRGPISVETRGFVARTVANESVSPDQVEKYTVRHFHNLDEAAISGIQYESPCVQCHGDYPHEKTVKVRAFFNAHSWFMACEVCHLRPADAAEFTYRWLGYESDGELPALSGSAGSYGARIVPMRIGNGAPQRLDQLADEGFIDLYLQSKSELSPEQDEAALETIHKRLTQAPVSCDGCHGEGGILDFRKLLYPPHVASHLESIDVAAMVATYQEFHLPKVLESTD